VIGALQATETLKLLLNIGTPLIGRMLLWDALTAQFDEVAVAQDPKCDACGA
jgi:adenylyltransferase/sulfurtransferase